MRGPHGGGRNGRRQEDETILRSEENGRGHLRHVP